LVGNVGQANAAEFTDVNSDHRFYKEIMFLYEGNIISGYGEGEFKPNVKVTRGQAAMMIAKSLGLDTTPRDSKFFKDIHKTDRFSGAIDSAREREIIQGKEDGTFDSDEEVSRGDMTMFIARAFKMTEEEAISFSDVSLNSRSYSSIRRIVTAGIAEGYENGKFGTNDSIKRSDFSAFLARALKEEYRVPVNVCGYVPEPGENPDRQTVNCLLTREALKANVPPEIVKAVASQENGAWEQFEANGETNISYDGGIGLMQITETTGYTVDRLKNDLTYNIYAGVDKLSKNFNRSDLPSVGTKDRNALESWYFAVMAYNGTKAVNSPFVKATGLRNDKERIINNEVIKAAYQERIFSSLSNSYVSTHIDSIDMNVDDFTYTADDRIKFEKLYFPIVGNKMTLSKEIFEAGNEVQYTGNGLRPQPGTKPDLYVTKTTVQDTITIVGGLVYDNNNLNNTFAWYPAKVEKNGQNYYGYISSPYIK
jgi:hypothetical protein